MQGLFIAGALLPAALVVLMILFALVTRAKS